MVFEGVALRTHQWRWWHKKDVHTGTVTSWKTLKQSRRVGAGRKDSQ